MYERGYKALGFMGVSEIESACLEAYQEKKEVFCFTQDYSHLPHQQHL